MTERNDWPKYRMIINGNPEWLTLHSAGVAFDSGHVPVAIGGEVLNEDASVRQITPAERRQISDIADEWSASK